MATQSSVAKRLHSELMSLMGETIPGVSAFPEDTDIQKWKATVSCPSSDVFAGMDFSLSLSFPSSYPMTAPTVKFETPIFHPNIDMSGNICLDILKDKWSATYTVSTLLLSIQALLETPNNDSPLNNQAAELWENRKEFSKLATRRYQGLPIA